MRRKRYPILEFDPEREAVIHPSNVVDPADKPEKCVICFFHEVLLGLVASGKARRIELGQVQLHHVACGHMLPDQLCFGCASMSLGF